MFTLISKLVAIASLLLGLYIGFYIGEWSGVNKGVAKANNKQNVAIIEKVKQNAKTKFKNNALTNDELKSKYCHWVYDVSYDECLRTNIYVD